MELTILGRYGPLPAAGGATSAYCVASAGTRILLDFGTGALSRTGGGLSGVDADAIVLSHLHYDHIADIFPIRLFNVAKSAFFAFSNAFWITSLWRSVRA